MLIFEIFPKEAWFMLGVAFVWIIVAVFMDFKKREVENWWNFSLMAFILAYRAFVSVSTSNAWWFYWGLIGLVGGFVLANLFYYARLFAGGDAKLLMALGTILPFSLSWKENLNILLVFIFAFFIAGAIYGAVYSIILMIKHFKKFRVEFNKNFNKNKVLVLGISIFFLILLIIFILLSYYLLAVLAFMVAISPSLILSAKSLENTCMNSQVLVKNLTIGDWIVENIKVGRKTIKPNWEGLSEEDLALIKKYKKKNFKVSVKEGIPFTPAFLLGLLITIMLLYRISFFNL